MSLKLYFFNPDDYGYEFSVMASSPDEAGALGITVCDRWKTSYESFINDMGNMPSPHHSIDRFPNKSGNYEPHNCRWATQSEQTNNTCRNVYTVFNGIQMSAAEFMRQTGIKSRWAAVLLKTQSADEVYELYKRKNKI